MVTSSVIRPGITSGFTRKEILEIQWFSECNGTSVRTEYYSAEDFGRIIFWFFWQNKLSGSKSYFGRNTIISVEIALFWQRCTCFGVETNIFSKYTSCAGWQKSYSMPIFQTETGLYWQILVSFGRNGSVSAKIDPFCQKEDNFGGISCFCRISVFPNDLFRFSVFR